ncbi:hypothetical protein K7432_000245 [Basidiobolus ranarum]|uniref:Uncharacterized protein n=1 Tax=Basidiobolus ranarum TaxID=34480 RepID=A0ABR2X4Y1_9FUNG
MDHGRSPPINTSKPPESKSSTSEQSFHTITNTTSKSTRSRSNSPVPTSHPKNPLHNDSPSYATSRNSRFDPYNFSRPSRERDDRREREREDRFRRRNDRELHREDRPPPHGPNHPFIPSSYYPHNRRAGADFEENKRLGGASGSSSMSAFANRRSSNTNGPPPIVISRDPTSGNVLMRSGGADIAPLDIVFPGMVDREVSNGEAYTN